MPVDLSRDQIDELRRHLPALSDPSSSWASAHDYQEARQAAADALPSLLAALDTRDACLRRFRDGTKLDEDMAIWFQPDPHGKKPARLTASEQLVIYASVEREATTP